MICDGKVAKVYQTLIEGLGVVISKEKSLISTKRRAGEFAKLFWVDSLHTNCSPVSPKLLLRSHHPFSLLAIYEKYGVTDLKVLSRLQGARFKQRCKPVSEQKRFHGYIWKKGNTQTFPSG